MTARAENEVRLFWRCVRDFQAAVASGRPRLIFEELEELRGIHMHTDHTVIRHRCAELLKDWK